MKPLSVGLLGREKSSVTLFWYATDLIAGDKLAALIDTDGARITRRLAYPFKRRDDIRPTISETWNVKTPSRGASAFWCAIACHLIVDAPHLLLVDDPTLTPQHHVHSAIPITHAGVEDVFDPLFERALPGRRER